MNHLVPPKLPPPEACIDVMAALRRGADGADFAIADRLELHMPRDSTFVQGTGLSQLNLNHSDDLTPPFSAPAKPTAALGPPSTAGAAAQEPCVMEGWARFRDGRWPCLRSLALYNDGFPSPVHSHAMALAHAATEQGQPEQVEQDGSVAKGQPRRRPWVWVPTLELSNHFWERPPKRGPDDAGRPPPFLRVRFTTAFVHRGLLMCESEVWGDGQASEKEQPALYSSSRQYARILVPKSSKRATSAHAHGTS